jgi:transposase
VICVGVEGTGSYGAGLARALTAAHVRVVEVDRPDRRTRRRRGKSDALDALAAARAARSGEADGVPKTRSGPVEAIRAMRVTRRGAIKARAAALNQLHGLVVSAPEPLREELTPLRGTALLRRCAGFRIDDNRLHEPVTATKAALQAVARRITALTEEVRQADRRLRALVTSTAPQTTALFGVGVDVAAQLLISAGDNPERLRSEAAFAHLCAGGSVVAHTCDDGDVEGVVRGPVAAAVQPVSVDAPGACRYWRGSVPTSRDGQLRA